MNNYAQIPGGKNELKPLLYQFHSSYPFKIWSKYRWFKNSKLRLVLETLNKQRKWLTLVDRLGAPGDALITANVVRCLKKVFPKLRINCITPHPELIRLDPNINSINQPETFYSFDSTYWELIVRKEKSQNIIEHNMLNLGINKYEYKSLYYPSQEEKEWAKKKVTHLGKPVLAICTKSKESVKNWPEASWLKLIENLKAKFYIIHLGDNKEPLYNEVFRYAGKLTKRETAAILSRADYFIGPDSLLMHIANGLDIPSVIIFGGSRPVRCFGYPQNINLYNSPSCSPCWIHDGFETCTHQIKCMTETNIRDVIKAINSLVKQSTKKIQNN